MRNALTGRGLKLIRERKKKYLKNKAINLKFKVNKIELKMIN